MDIHGALSLRCHNLNAKLVLIIPRSSDYHLERLRKKYVGFKTTKSTTGAVNIRRRTMKSSGCESFLHFKRWLSALISDILTELQISFAGFDNLNNPTSTLSILEVSQSLGNGLRDLVGAAVSEAEVLHYIENNLRRLVSSLQYSINMCDGVGRDGYYANSK